MIYIGAIMANVLKIYFDVPVPCIFQISNNGVLSEKTVDVGTHVIESPLDLNKLHTIDIAHDGSDMIYFKSMWHGYIDLTPLIITGVATPLYQLFDKSGNKIGDFVNDIGAPDVLRVTIYGNMSMYVDSLYNFSLNMLPSMVFK
jgi:hypothetical protein